MEKQKFIEECEKNGLMPQFYNNDTHWQIKNDKIIVNYYPSTGKIYIGSTVSGFRARSYMDAIEFAKGELKLEEITPVHRNKRKRKGYVSQKQKLFKKKQTCHWCGIKLTLDRDHIDTTDLCKATLEHIIPLKKGGLDNMNNMTLACQRCNLKNQ